jgi:hypothetical protein
MYMNFFNYEIKKSELSHIKINVYLCKLKYNQYY